MAQTFRTTSCTAHGHPELTITLERPVPVPDLQGFLLGYFEQQVSNGVRFKPGEIVDFAGSPLRIVERPDHTLGVAEPGENGWNETVHESLMRTWCRLEVARSFDLEPEFPSAAGTIVTCTRLASSIHAMMLKRATPVAESRDTGWYVGCTDEGHDHDDTENLSVVSISALVVSYPWIGQFLALPTGTDLVVEMADRVRVPVLWRGDDAVSPKPGSYIAALNTQATK